MSETKALLELMHALLDCVSDCFQTIESYAARLGISNEELCSQLAAKIPGFQDSMGGMILFDQKQADTPQPATQPSGTINNGDGDAGSHDKPTKTIKERVYEYLDAHPSAMPKLLTEMFGIKPQTASAYKSMHKQDKAKESRESNGNKPPGKILSDLPEKKQARQVKKLPAKNSADNSQDKVFLEKISTLSTNTINFCSVIKRKQGDNALLGVYDTFIGLLIDHSFSNSNHVKQAADYDEIKGCLIILLFILCRLMTIVKKLRRRLSAEEIQTIFSCDESTSLAILTHLDDRITNRSKPSGSKLRP